MKTFYFNFEDGLEQKYIDWAKEAVQDFINLFPEYKDNFATEEKNISYDDLDILQKLAAHNKQVYEERKRTQQSTKDFDETSFWQMFEKLPDGSYKASLKKQIALATHNGMVDIQKLSQLQADSAGNMYSSASPILVNITKKKAHGNIRGISSETSVNISAGTCAALGYEGEDLKAYFKDIIIHELGHTFNATHKKRQNAVDNLGWHCKDKNCLMYEYAYTDESFNRRKKLKEPFCADCMTSMRNFMQNTLHFTKTKTQSNDNQLQSVNFQKQNSIANIPYFANLTQEEIKLLEAYDKYLADNNISRDDKDKFFDKIYLIASIHAGTNQSGKKPDLSPDTFDFKYYSKTNWNEPFNLKSLRTKIYEEKKFAKYSTDLWDGKTPATRDKNGKVTYFACGGQTQKGDELAIRMLDTTDMKTQGDFLSSGWIFRLPPSLKNSNAVQRFAVNALPDKKLFDDLDAFVKKHNAYYKTATPYGWHRRNDPVVIYCTQTPDKATIDELKTIMAPYIRREKPDRMNDLDGTLIADGLITAKEPSLDEIKKLFDEIKTYNPNLAEALRQEIKEGNNPNNPLSLGQFEAYKKILENYKQVFKPLQMLYVNQGNDKQSTTENEPNAVIDKDFKKVLREIFQPSAEKQKAEYKEDIKAPDYRAEIKHANGSVDKIVAKSATNITLSAKDKDGKPKVPNMQRFRDIVALAQKQGSVIEFGDIKSPDFKARLMLACMEAKPAMQMVGAPELNDEFLQSIQDEKLKGVLQIMKNKQQTQQQSKPQQNQQEATPAPEPKTQPTAETKPQPKPQPQQPTPAPQTEYEKSRETRRKSLEAKEKLGKISKMEKAELDYIRAYTMKQIELKKAKTKYNSPEPRSEDHKQKTGFDAEDYYFTPSQRHSYDWKLHLDVVPNHNHPTTKAISEMLEKIDVEHKIAHGGKNGKGMTIYVGNYADTLRLSKEINARFGKDLEPSPCYVNQALQEHYFNPKVCGRFYMQNTFQAQYPRSSVAGISPASSSANLEMDMDEGTHKIFDLGQKNKIIPAKDKFSDSSYDVLYFADGDFHKSYIFHNLEAYCSHKLYEKELGEYYCGKDADKFEKDFFGDKIPEKGTVERANWDKAADEYVTFIENTHPNIIQMMKSRIHSKSIDFSKLPPMPQNTQVRGGGRSA